MTLVYAGEGRILGRACHSAHRFGSSVEPGRARSPGHLEERDRLSGLRIPGNKDSEEGFPRRLAWSLLKTLLKQPRAH